MNGVNATQIIMQDTPTAILIVTADGLNETKLVFEAMGEGALDAMSISIKQGEIVEGQELLRKIDIIGRLKGKLKLPSKTKPVDKELPLMGNGEPYPILLAIGASTGGPVALSKILTQLPATLPLAIVIIQHVDEKFIGGLAHWLEEHAERRIQLAVTGEFPSSERVLLAGRNQHLAVRYNGSLHYTAIPRDCPYCPSVDVFFHSLSQHWPQRSIAVLLTGMGNDGARGMKSLYDKGWHTIAEHEKSCVIYGMPRAAIETAAVAEVIECDHMAAAILTAYRDIVKK